MDIRIVTEILVVCVCLVVCMGKDCMKQDMCSCQFDDGSGIVDLTSLGHSDNTPRFKDVPCDTDGWLYSYNPCGGFTEDICDGTALCGQNPDGGQSMALGQANDVKFQYDDDTGNVAAGYLVMGTPIVSTEVDIICDATACDPQFVPQGGVGTTYKMQLTSVCACPGMCSASGPIKQCSSSSPSPSATALSTGSVLLIGFFGVIAFYIVSGVVYQKVSKEASGTDLIPNKHLWKTLLTYIAGGFKLVFCSVRSREISYDKT